MMNEYEVEFSRESLLHIFPFQGPLPGTVSEFWRLVWEQRVGLVVMITNLVEQGKRKCEQYWPETGSLMLGLIEVTIVQESVQAHCTVRTLRLRHTRLQRRAEAGAVREVTQHQYTSWPDHGTPTNIAPVLSFIKKSSSACQVRHKIKRTHGSNLASNTFVFT